MTLALQSTGDKNTIHAAFEGPEDMDMVQLARTRESDDLHVVRIGKTHDPCQVRRSKCAVVAGKGQYVRLPTRRGLMRLLNS